MAALTGYGWTASADPVKGWGGNATIDCYGIKFHMRRRLYKDDSADRWMEHCWRWLIFSLNRRVERCSLGSQADEWSYYFKLNTNNPSAGNYSQHAGGQAFDWNSLRHPNGTTKYTGFTKAQVATIMAILAEAENIFYWGGLYRSRVDPMHFEVHDGLADDAGHAKIKRVAQKLLKLMQADPTNFGLAPEKPADVPPPVVVKPWTFTASRGIAVGPIDPAVLWQGGIMNPLTGETLVTIANSKTDSLFVRMAADRTTQLDSMRVTGTNAHQTQFGWLPDGMVTMTVNDSRGNDIVELPYKAGTVKARSGRSLHVGTNLPTQMAISPTGKFAVIRRFDAGNQETFFRVLLEKVRGSDPLDLEKDCIGVPVVVTPNSIPTQGFGTEGADLVILKGATDTTKNANRRYLELKSFADGKHKKTQPIDDLGSTTVSVEPEGMDGVDFWLKEGTGKARRLVRYQHNLTDWSA